MDVFLHKGEEKAGDRLMTISAKKSSEPENSAFKQEKEKITIKNGLLKITHGLWGHREPDLLGKIFDGVSTVVTAPGISGLGIPLLVGTAAQFVNMAHKRYREEGKIKEILTTQELEFRIAGDAEAMFTLAPGTWILIDRKYYFDSQRLKDHFLDFEGHSLTLRKGTGRGTPVSDGGAPVSDATYIVVELYFKGLTKDPKC
jgi:hypothetical protein